MTHRCPIALASVFAMLLTGVLPGPARAQAGPNILMIIADDVGVDVLGAYQSLVGSQEVPPTPTIDRLAAQGILFRNAWSNPSCATTRATIQTGRYSYRTGILSMLGTLAAEESSIAEILNQDAAVNYTCATFGKWGLFKQDASVPFREATRHPVKTGYDFFAGRPDAGIGDYYNWQKHVAAFNVASGCDRNDPASYTRPVCLPLSIQNVTQYATTTNVTDALDWIGSLPSVQPWFVILSFNAAHSPYHVPPTDLHGYGDGILSCPGDDEATCYRAMIEAMDTEIQRLLDHLPAGDTTIIFLGDNGTPKGKVADPLPDRAKRTLYQGGINVPLIIAGSDVLGPARVSEALVNTTDLFMTVLELAGVDPSVLPTELPDNPGDPLYNGQEWEHDSFSLAPILRDACDGGCEVEGIREYAYAETASSRTIRNRAGYKLIQNLGSGQEACEFYLLGDDSPFEKDDLVDPQTWCELVEPDPTVQAILDDLKHRLGDLEPGEPFRDPNLPAANLDRDADGVAEDGDGSGVSGDSPCTGGGRANCDDNCPTVSNPGQGEADGDGVGDACDNCLVLHNRNQHDTDGDGYGNMCDPDYDNDLVVDQSDLIALKAAWHCDLTMACYVEEIDSEPNGSIQQFDLSRFNQKWQQPPGPSGLSCAGTPPCPK